jgi:hypothetical protein
MIMNIAGIYSGARPFELSCAIPALPESVSRYCLPNVRLLDVSDRAPTLVEMIPCVLGARVKTEVDTRGLSGGI